MPKALRSPGGAFHMNLNHYNPIRLMATVLGGIGMFGALSVFKVVLVGPYRPLSELLFPVFISGMLIGAALMLVQIADTADKMKGRR